MNSNLLSATLRLDRVPHPPSWLCCVLTSVARALNYPDLSAWLPLSGPHVDTFPLKVTFIRPVFLVDSREGPAAPPQRHVKFASLGLKLIGRNWLVLSPGPSPDTGRSGHPPCCRTPLKWLLLVVITRFTSPKGVRSSFEELV